MGHYIWSPREMRETYGYDTERIIDILHDNFYRYWNVHPRKFYFEDTLYRVTVSSTRGAHHPEEGDTVIVKYEGDDYEMAVDICNRADRYRDAWFERVNPPMDALSVAQRKFDALIEFINSGGLG